MSGQENIDGEISTRRNGFQSVRTSRPYFPGGRGSTLLPKPHARAFPVLLDEDHAGRFEGGAHRGDSLSRNHASLVFEIHDGRKPQSRRLRELSLSAIEQRSRGPALGWFQCTARPSAGSSARSP
jgi:hypothetical protein